ncbi:hypothetical protein [Ilumatobacter nonamiensis]|uniref:hypothetical protein n=1 Tax=Ilumatobacter nonamiensis TaxID=467093 RepID=UPI00034B9BC0|nr:hypothetical protein [Ilumatobacter nonamiensis]
MITALLVLAVAAVIGFGVALTVRSKRDFAQQNEIVPGEKSPAPASWAGAHSREAKLHRRLGAAVRGAHENPRLVELGLAPQMRSIDAEALAIDERLVASAALPAAHREAAIDTVEEHVVALESTIAEMVTSITVADSKAQLEQAVSAADLKLHALAQARAEVELIDRQVAGTDDASNEVARHAQPAPPPPATSPPSEPPPRPATSPDDPPAAAADEHNA